MSGPVRGVADDRRVGSASPPRGSSGTVEPSAVTRPSVCDKPAYLIGEEVLATLRRSGRLETLCVVVLTGLERGFDVEGAYLVLPEPIGLHQIVSHMEHICTWS
jgi:hypothetical protein